VTIQQLKYFSALAQLQHFGAAARACYVSQPSLSHSILELENEVGTQLVYRDSRNVVLSAAGKVFYEETKNLLSLLDEAVIKAQRAAAGLSGRISIGSLGGLADSVFLTGIRRFKQDNPSIDVSFCQTNMKALSTRLMQGNLDIILTRELDIRTQDREVQWLRFRSDRFGFLLPSDSPLLANSTPDCEALIDAPFVFLDDQLTPNIFRYLMQLCTARSFVPHIVQKAPTLEILCNLVRTGMGITIAPECALMYGSGDLRFLPLTGEDAVSEIVFAWRRKHMNPVIPVFLEAFNLDSDDAEHCF